jgi:hypothetical protein
MENKGWPLVVTDSRILGVMSICQTSTPSISVLPTFASNFLPSFSSDLGRFGRKSLSCLHRRLLGRDLQCHPTASRLTLTSNNFVRKLFPTDIRQLFAEKTALKVNAVPSLATTQVHIECLPDLVFCNQVIHLLTQVIPLCLCLAGGKGNLVISLL